MGEGQQRDLAVAEGEIQASLEVSLLSEGKQVTSNSQDNVFPQKICFYPVHVDLVPLEVVLGRVELGDDATEGHENKLFKHLFKYIIVRF